MRTLLVALISFTPLAAQSAGPHEGIRSILADRCFPCHGPDSGSRQAGLRLDLRDGALAVLPSGRRAVVPGHPERSAMMARLRHADPAARMPPITSHRTVSETEIRRLEEWIRDGANWEAHWAYIPPTRPAVPAVADRTAVLNPIDAFLLARLEREGIRSSPAADERTLARRLSLDLTGLPPTPAAADRLATHPDQYEAVVDELMRSPHFGERMAVFWLDLVRYADTSGYHGDQPVPFWPYRDWVINAFNDGMPFDAFTAAQLAGDLLPDPTQEDLVASGYNHLNQKTSEGGAQDKEYLAIYRADRVRTTSSVWMGVTLGCAQCHDHKFDPFTADDFYSFAAIFEDINEKGYYAGSKWTPAMKVPTPDQRRRLAELDRKITAAQARFDADTPELSSARDAWATRTLADLERQSLPRLGPWSSTRPYRATDFDTAYAKAFAPEKAPEKAEWRPQPSWVDGEIHRLRGDNSATYLRRTITASHDGPLALSLGSDDALKIWLDGEEVFARKVTRGVRPDQDKAEFPLSRGTHTLMMKVVNGGGGYGFYFRVTRSGPPDHVVAALRTPVAKRTPRHRSDIAAHHRSVTPLLADVRAELKRLRADRARAEAAVPTTLVSRAMKPRIVKRLRRGDWQDESGPIVKPRGPLFLEPITPTDGEGPVTRLDLARWLTSGKHPLTARVFVNRLWRMLFGTGLSRTVEDLGFQGEWPVHPELLDWLAVEFVESGWDVKHMIRLMVTSNAYRRSSAPRPDLRALDPDNRLHARQSTWRLDAEFVRDQAMAVSGLLNPSIGGPSVRPYQPPGYWRELNFPRRVYRHDTMPAAQHRRGLYTWWQRSFLHPSLRAFDAPSREECTAARPRSNTPLQALALLNDPTYVEAARAFAARLLTGTATSDAARVDDAYRLAFGRQPLAVERNRLLILLEGQRRRFAKAADAADAITSIGVAPAAAGLDPAEHAAWTQVARVILNLHEGITRP